MGKTREIGTLLLGSLEALKQRRDRVVAERHKPGAPSHASRLAKAADVILVRASCHDLAQKVPRASQRWSEKRDPCCIKHSFIAS